MTCTEDCERRDAFYGRRVFLRPEWIGEREEEDFGSERGEKKVKGVSGFGGENAYARVVCLSFYKCRSNHIGANRGK